MTSNHCISHRLHLAGKDASKDVIYFEKYEKTLKNLYSYFSKSHKSKSSFQPKERQKNKQIFARIL